jgi:hypothetical protein
VYGNRVLRREEVAGGWRGLHNEELHNLYDSVMVGWAGHGACMREIRNAYKILVGKSERKRPRGILGVYGKVILKWIVGK